MGPVASQIAIKMLGTNGGGFFNANAAHPFENPTALSNLVQMVSIFALGAALTNVFGRMVGNQRQGWAILAAMGVLFLAGVVVSYWAEAAGNPQLCSARPRPGNMEGKEVRFGIALSALFAVITTAASCGAVNAMHDQLHRARRHDPADQHPARRGHRRRRRRRPLRHAALRRHHHLRRRPDGRPHARNMSARRSRRKEVKMAMLAILVLPLMFLGWTAVATVMPSAVASILNPGPHGFSEILYLFTSSTGNNGSAFGGITGNTDFYNITGAVAMFVGRFFMIIPAMAIAGSLAAKKTVPASAGTFPTDGGLFVGLLVGVILIVGGLTFFPALALGPIVEHSAMQAGSCSNRTHRSDSMETSQSAQADAGLGADRPEDHLAGDRLGLRQARSARDDEEPGHVRGRGGRRADHGHLPPRLANGGEHLGFTFQIILWLWFTVLFANFAEAVAEGRGKAQAASLRQTREETKAKLIVDEQTGWSCHPAASSRRATSCWSRPATSSRPTAR